MKVSKTSPSSFVSNLSCLFGLVARLPDKDLNDLEQKQVTSIGFETLASEFSIPYEQVMLGMQANLTEKTHKIIKDIYSKRYVDRYMKKAQEDGLIRSASEFQDLINIRHLISHQLETLEGFGRFTNGEDNQNKSLRERYLASYNRIYDKTLKLLDYIKHTPEEVGTNEIIKDLDNLNLNEVSKLLDIDLYTLNDIIDSLKMPNRDYRDDYDMPLLKSDILTIDNLNIGMSLEGTVRNVVDFGAFIDIGLHNDGLVHISKITNKYIKHPSDVLSVGDIVTCYVIEINKEKEKVSLSLINPNN